MDLLLMFDTTDGNRKHQPRFNNFKKPCRIFFAKEGSQSSQPTELVISPVARLQLRLHIMSRIGL
jgi:hypothetical protein